MSNYASSKYITKIKVKKQSPLKFADDAARAIKLKLSKSKIAGEEGSEEKE